MSNKYYDLFKNKYLKYKNKYLNLKKILGGAKKININNEKKKIISV